ncbi:ATP-binding protein [Methanocaldococcus indicus]|uniref:ATP-binding protein n=1 Tax=Methanocaldococcus indicus TaxID=213231 RepID=UPI003C6D1275
MKIIEKTTANTCYIGSETPLELGEYLLLKNFKNENVLGIVKDIEFKDNIFINSIKIVGVLKDNKIFINKSPINPNSPALIASDEILKQIFYIPDGITIGHLLTRKSIRVALDTNKLISRHFAILSITGGGKSNTVAVLCKELAKKNATIIIIDPHGEYANLSHEELYGKVNVIIPSINPSFLTAEELSVMLGINNEEMKIYLKYAYDTIKYERKSGHEFINSLIDLLYSWVQAAEVGWEIKYYNTYKRKYERKKVEGKDFQILSSLYNLMNNFLEEFSLFISDTDIIEQLKPNKINVINLSGLELHQMLSIVSYISKEILTKRILYIKSLKDLNCKNERVRELAIKNLETIRMKYSIVTKPLLLIVEEAHIFIPRDEKTSTSLWLGKIAREGRKFGIGLGLVSQRPKQLNPDVLSQTGTKIVLRIVEPEDQKYIQKVSEDLAEDLTKDLASLDIGEALIFGIAVNLPAIVKIDKFDGVYGGKDIDIVGEWRGF